MIYSQIQCLGSHSKESEFYLRLSPSLLCSQRGFFLEFFLTSNLTMLETLPTQQIPDVEVDKINCNIK